MIGIGFSSGAEAVEIASLANTVLAGRDAAVLAVPAHLAKRPNLLAAASMLGLPVTAVMADAIEAEQPRCLTRPCRAFRAVAEGAALAIAGPGGLLLGPRSQSRRVTCAIAERGLLRHAQ